MGALGGREFSSFRDPSGYLFWRQGRLYRCVQPSYAVQFDAAEASGLFKTSIADGLLLPFERLADHASLVPHSHAVLAPTILEQVSYPYEWSFEQLKDAALLTLDLHLRALENDLLLKDASAYNVQFQNGRAVFIDHLSFDLIENHEAWPAYGQFCRHFLAPLTLMAKVDVGLNRLLQLHIDGVPLDLASRMLPRSTMLRPGLYMHLHLHAKMVTRHGDEKKKVEKRRLNARQLTAIAGSLRDLVAGLKPPGLETEWGEYYEDTNYDDVAFQAKKNLVREFVKIADPKSMWDVGGNDGTFSRAVADLVPRIVCMDIDPTAVNKNYVSCRSQGIQNILPLVVDLTNPSPSIGFANNERLQITKRGNPDLILALALIHHLALSSNLH